jgi:hypothetical protein
MNYLCVDGLFISFLRNYPHVVNASELPLLMRYIYTLCIKETKWAIENGPITRDTGKKKQQNKQTSVCGSYQTYTVLLISQFINT